MSTHTPGPWRLDAKISDHFSGHDASLMVGDYHFIDAGDSYFPRGFSVSAHMSRADANLIAAAPDLLAMLKTARGRIHSDICGEECCQDCIESQREIDRAEVPPILVPCSAYFARGEMCPCEVAARKP